MKQEAASTFPFHDRLKDDGVALRRIAAPRDRSASFRRKFSEVNS